MWAKVAVCATHILACSSLSSRLFRSFEEDGQPLSNVYVGKLDFPDPKDKAMYECSGTDCPFRLTYTNFADAVSTSPRPVQSFHQYWPIDTDMEEVGFNNQERSVANETKVLPNMLLYNLSSSMITKLKSCPVEKRLKGDSGGGESGRVLPGLSWNSDGSQIWILLIGEHPPVYRVKEILKNATSHGKRFIVLGPYKPGQFNNPNVVELWVPYASISFANRGAHTPLDLVNREDATVDRKYIAGYQAQDCTYRREVFWDNLCRHLQSENKQCTYLSNCNGFSYLGDKWEENIGEWKAGTGKYDNSVDRYSQFKFIESFESDRGAESLPNYVTEKIVDVLLARAVPIYGYSPGVMEMFNPDTFLFWDKDKNNTDEVIGQVDALLADDNKYKKMVSSPAVSESQMIEFFSWHPAVFPKYGDSLRLKILNQIIDWCDDKVWSSKAEDDSDMTLPHRHR